MPSAVGFQVFISEFCSSLPPTRSKLPLRLSWFWEMRPLGFSGGFQCNSTVVELMIMRWGVTQTPGKNDTMRFYCEDKIHASWHGAAPSTSQLALICGLKQSHCGRNKHAFPVLWGEKQVTKHGFTFECHTAGCGTFLWLGHRSGCNSMKSGRRNVGIWNPGALWVMWKKAQSGIYWNYIGQWVRMSSSLLYCGLCVSVFSGILSGPTSQVSKILQLSL